MNHLLPLIEQIGLLIDIAGVLIILIGILLASLRALLPGQPAAPSAIDPAESSPARYLLYRQRLGRAILLGLEFLVAGDIIRTVAVAPTLSNLAVLAVIVLIRTFLSYSLELEVSGRWPWQKNSPR